VRAEPRDSVLHCANRQGGFTLLELMAVVGVIAVLMGLGLGFLGRTSGVPEARVAIGAELRLAALDARSRGMPTEVVLTPGELALPAEVRARALLPVAVYPFDPGVQPVSLELLGREGGQIVDEGRCGKARRLGGEDDGAALTVALAPRTVDFQSGLAVRLDLHLDERGAGQVFKLGEALQVYLDPDAQPRVRFVSRGADGRAGDAYNLQPEVALPVRRWCQFEVGADGSNLWCALDGRVLQVVPCTQRLHQTNGDVFEVLPTGEPLAAAVDEVQLFQYAFSEPSRLQQGLELKEPVRVRFDALGRAVATGPIRFVVVSEEREVEWTVTTEGVLQ
jgi:prepilin-type N-terminal cleavage/methylation domain-containing protein